MPRLDFTRPIILLDMDGVLSDFFTHYCRVLKGMNDTEITILYNTFPANTYYISDVFGESLQQSLQRIDALGYGFWADMPMYSTAIELVQYCKRVTDDNVGFCSSGSGLGSAADGKTRWLQNYFGGVENLTITQNKALCAGAKTILIDDSDTECSRFTSTGSGASSILYPRPWNSLACHHFDEREALSYIMKKIDLAVLQRIVMCDAG